jgi:molybdate transport system regulatory protein
MKISARNQLQGKISAVNPGSVNSEIEITLGSGDKIIAIVTNKSAQSLGLTLGKEVFALVKASSVLVLTGTSGIALSARNVLKGKVSKVHTGPISAEVTITLSGGTSIHATITHEAVDELTIKEGIEASAVFKASSVIIGVSN